MEEVLAQAKEALMAFFTSLPAVSQVIVSREARTVLLKNPADWLPGPRNPDQDNDQEEEQEEDEENTVINREVNGDRQEDLQDT